MPLGHVDRVRTLASFTGQKTPADSATDAVDARGALLGDIGAKGRESLVLQNNQQAALALRVGAGKLIQKPNGASEPGRVKAMTAQLAAERAKSQ